MYISVFQDVTDWFVRLIDELEQSFIEFLKEALEEDSKKFLELYIFIFI